MQPSLDNTFRFACVDGETITITATTSPNTSVTFALDSNTAVAQNAIRVTLNKQSGGAQFVVALVRFPGSSGAFCNFEVTSDQGGSSRHNIDQGKKSIAGRLYQFDIA